MNSLDLNATGELNDQIKVRLDTLQKIKSRGELAYKNGLSPDQLAGTLHQEFDEKSKEELEGNQVHASVAGRIMAIRSFGKAAFVQLQDRSGKIQLYFQKQSLGDESFAKFLEIDIGDVVFVKGFLFKTKTNELSIHAEEFSMLTKSLRPLPEKFHGLTDIEVKYRQRYLDLMTSEETRKVFQVRSKIVSSMRDFFSKKDFLEVETPMMHPVAGGAAAKPFVTHHHTLDCELFLRIAPELYLKRLLVGGFDRVFEINRNFRNEGISIKHNPEFTMLEFYMAYATYEDLMDLTEELFQKLADDVLGTRTITYQGSEIKLDGKWKRQTVEDAIIEYSGFKDREKLRNKDALVSYLKEKHYECNPADPVGKMMMTIFDEEVEKNLIQPTFITQYPLDVSPLSRKNESDPFLVDRFEIYIYGREMGNAFSELNDPIDQKKRFMDQLDAKNRGDEEANDMDDDYVVALEYGMPPAAGEGIGIDRLVMLFTDQASIRDVILFPQLKPQKSNHEK